MQLAAAAVSRRAGGGALPADDTDTLVAGNLFLPSANVASSTTQRKRESEERESERRF
jgi:hypothetical protein